jgi:hypothetical protein
MIKTCCEYLIVAVIAVLMALVGYWLMDVYGAAQGRSEYFLKLHDVGWTVWLSLISAITWVYLYSHCRSLHWLVLPVMGLVSPVIGAVLFFLPFLWAPWVVLWQYALVIFPVGLASGFIISTATLPLRPRGVLQGNVDPTLVS